MSDMISYIDFLKTQKKKQKKFKDPHNPENFGGVWIACHILARDVKTREHKVYQASSILKIMIGLGCEKCVNHIKEWLILNPIQATFDGDEYSLFDWTVRAHNYASSNAGNPQMSLEEARKIFYVDKKCKDETCSHHSVIPPKILPKKINRL